MTAFLAHPYYPASPVRPIRGYYYLMSNKRHIRRMSYVISFLLSTPVLVATMRRNFGVSRGRRGGNTTLTNSECKSWLIVVDTVTLQIFRLPNSEPG